MTEEDRSDVFEKRVDLGGERWVVIRTTLLRKDGQSKVQMEVASRSDGVTDAEATGALLAHQRDVVAGFEEAGIKTGNLRVIPHSGKVAEG